MCGFRNVEPCPRFDFSIGTSKRPEMMEGEALGRVSISPPGFSEASAPNCAYGEGTGARTCRSGGIQCHQKVGEGAAGGEWRLGPASGISTQPVGDTRSRDQRTHTVGI